MTDLKNKTAIITGSVRGIGRAIAERYAKLGANIVLNYSKDQSSAEEATEAIKRLGGNVIAVQGDVSKIEDVNRLFETAINTFGKVDIVVANAGVEKVDHPVLEISEEEFDTFFGINTKGAFFTLQNAAKHVAENGRIILVGSSTSGYPMPGVGLYGSSKAAPRYLVQVLAMEVARKGITVNAIIPTTIQGAGIFTEIAEDDHFKQWVEEFNPMGRMGLPEDVTNVAEFFAGNLSSFVSGQSLLVSGGGLA